MANKSVGRYDIGVRCLDYDPTIIRAIIVASAKETYINAELKDTSSLLEELVVRSRVNIEQPINAMAIVGARMLSEEEAKRYAGGFDDSARVLLHLQGQLVIIGLMV
jgi:hypothetical protein